MILFLAARMDRAMEVRSVVEVPGRGGHQIRAYDASLSESEYEVVAFATWSASLRGRVWAKRVLAFDWARWLAEGKSRSAERIASELGWSSEMPEAFAVASSHASIFRAGTIAL